MLYDYLIQGIGRADFSAEDARKVFEFFEFDTEILDDRDKFSSIPVWKIPFAKRERFREMFRRCRYVDISGIWLDIKDIESGRLEIRDKYLLSMCLNPAQDDLPHYEKILHTWLGDSEPLEPEDWVKLFLDDNVFHNAFLLVGMKFCDEEIKGIVKWKGLTHVV